MDLCPIWMSCLPAALVAAGLGSRGSGAPGRARYLWQTSSSPGTCGSRFPPAPRLHRTAWFPHSRTVRPRGWGCWALTVAPSWQRGGRSLGRPEAGVRRGPCLPHGPSWLLDLPFWPNPELQILPSGPACPPHPMGCFQIFCFSFELQTEGLGHAQPALALFIFIFLFQNRVLPDCPSWA